MRTEADLRAALRSLERHTPDPASVLGAVEQGPRRVGARRRAGLVVAAAVLVGAIAVGAGLLADRSQVPTAQRPLQLSFVVDLGADMHHSFVWEPDRQRVTVAGGADVAWVSVYRPGAFDPTPARGGEPVTVQGRPGFYVSERITSLSPREFGLGVFWEYQPDAWAIAYGLGQGGERGMSMRAAEAVRFGETVPLPVPYRIGHLPPGLSPASGQLETPETDPTRHISDVRLTGTATGFGLTITAMHQTAVNWKGDPRPVGEPVVNEDQASVSVYYGSFWLSLRSHDKSVLSADELVRIARSITPTPNYEDLGAWFDAPTAIPTGR